ncbi:MAG: recombinase family protein [Erysipelotrichaceae bacterium]|nr:recombinase family protein [Erysipelotrichaceae bacterium]
MMYYGYHRVSTKEQNLDRGVKGIEDFCKQKNYPLQKIFLDKMSGRVFDRPRYTVLKEDVLRTGDTLILYELDRLGRNKKDIIDELRYYEDHDIRVMFLDIPTSTIDLSEESNSMNKLITDTINKVVIEIYAMQAETELQRKEKRQREGIEAKKARGDWDDYGRHRVMSAEEFAKQYKKVEQGKIGSLELMRQLKMKKSTYFKYVNEYRNK